MTHMTARKKFILSALLLTGLLTTAPCAFAQETEDFTGRAGAIANRLNATLQNFVPNKETSRLRPILAHDDTGQQRRVIADMWRNVRIFPRFTAGSHTLLPKAKKLLMDVGGALEELKENKGSFLIIGHTDTSGSNINNQRLSRRRAMAVRDFLLQKFNLNPRRLLFAGLGESSPYNTENPASAKNRRIEIVLIDHFVTTTGQRFSGNRRGLDKKWPAPSSNVVCKSYQGARLHDIRPQHMKMDDYDARTSIFCSDSTKPVRNRP